MIEFYALGITVLSLFGGLFYKFGNMNGRISSVENNVEWIRNHLLSSTIDINKFNQKSPISYNGNLENDIPDYWKKILNGMEIDSTKYIDPFDCAVEITKEFGCVNLDTLAKKHNMDSNTMLLMGAIYLIEKDK